MPINKTDLDKRKMKWWNRFITKQYECGGNPDKLSKEFDSIIDEALAQQKEDISLKIASYSNLSVEQTEDLLKLINETT